MLVIRVVAGAEAVSFDAHGNLDAAAQIELLSSYSVPTRCPAPEQRVGRQLSSGMKPADPIKTGLDDRWFRVAGLGHRWWGKSRRRWCLQPRQPWPAIQKICLIVIERNQCLLLAGSICVVGQIQQIVLQ